jgi:hypothetical protein
MLDAVSAGFAAGDGGMSYYDVETAQNQLHSSASSARQDDDGQLFFSEQFEFRAPGSPISTKVFGAGEGR